MRVGIVCPYTWDVPGGVQAHVRDLSETLIGLGHEVSVLTPVDDPDGELPRSLRTTLWAEHLGLSQDDPDLRDLDGAGRLWASRVGQPGSRIREHVLPPVPRLRRLWAGPAYRVFFDPDGRPRETRGTDRF